MTPMASLTPMASTPVAPISFAPVAPVASVEPPAPIAPIPIKLKPEVVKPKVQPRPVTPPKQVESSPDIQSPRRVVQPCSLSCGSGVPSLSCAACLCMYHPLCAGYTPLHAGKPFLCKNCRKSSSPPPVVHKPTTSNTTPAPRRRLTKANSEHRVTLRMKVSGGSDGSRVWAVAAPRAPAARPSGPAPATLPQSLAIINGKRFIVVPRPAPLPTTTNQ